MSTQVDVLVASYGASTSQYHAVMMPIRFTLIGQFYCVTIGRLAGRKRIKSRAVN